MSILKPCFIRRTKKLLMSPWALGSLAGLLAAIVFVPFARFGIDPHHDGLMYAGASAVSKGFRVHTQVYAQYGPISTWLQALELQIFGDHLVVIKIGSALILSLAVTFFTISGIRIVGRIVTIFAITTWLLCSYFFEADLPMLAWSSDYYVLLSAISLLVLSQRVNRPSIHKSIDAYVLTVGALLSTGLFLRINPALPVLALVFLCFGLFGKRSEVISFAIGSILGILANLCLLLWIGGVADWWTQAIVQPRKLYAGTMTSGGLAGIKGNVLVNGVPALLAALLLLVFTEQFFDRRLSITRESIGVQVVGLASIATIAYLFAGNGFFQLLNPRVFLWSVVLGCFVFAPMAVRKLSLMDIGKQSSYILLLGIGIGSLIQVFPVADSRHLWWATFPGLLLLFSLVPKWTNKRAQIFVHSFFCIVLALPAINRAQDTLKITRVKIANSPMLSGMLSSKDYATAFGDYFDFINDFEKVHGSRSVINLCADGLYAVAGSTFDYPDPYYVYWAFPPNSWAESSRQEFIKINEPFIWICTPIGNASETAASYGYRIVRRPECLTNIDRFNQWPLQGNLAVPNSWSPIPSEQSIAEKNVCQGL